VRRARLLVLASSAFLWVLGCATAPTPALDCESSQGDWAAWNYRAEMGYLDSTYMAYRDSILEAQFLKRASR
jgi:hypothetical protein